MVCFGGIFWFVFEVWRDDWKGGVQEAYDRIVHGRRQGKTIVTFRRGWWGDMVEYFSVHGRTVVPFVSRTLFWVREIMTTGVWP